MFDETKVLQMQGFCFFDVTPVLSFCYLTVLSTAMESKPTY
jgi:hypothetical protein